MPVPRYDHHRVNTDDFILNGYKVEPKNAPVVKESAGKVASESLAAESKREGGEFASNRGIRSENDSSESKSAESKSLGSKSSESKSLGSKGSESKASEPKSSGVKKSTGSSENTQSHGSRDEQTSSTSGSSAQKHTETKGPHGKNLEGGDWDDSKAKDGLKLALESEPGSENDPSRLAEQRFRRQANPGGTAMDLDTNTKYDALNPEEST